MTISKDENMLSHNIWFISRHEGAIAWAIQQNLPITQWCAHLNIELIQKNDVVIGTLPIHLANAICAKGAIFYYLQITVPAHLRGTELSKEQMNEFGCELNRYKIEKIP